MNLHWIMSNVPLLSYVVVETARKADLRQKRRWNREEHSSRKRKHCARRTIPFSRGRLEYERREKSRLALNLRHGGHRPVTLSNEKTTSQPWVNRSAIHLANALRKPQRSAWNSNYLGLGFAAILGRGHLRIHGELLDLCVSPFLSFFFLFSWSWSFSIWRNASEREKERERERERERELEQSRTTAPKRTSTKHLSG